MNHEEKAYAAADPAIPAYVESLLEPEDAVLAEIRALPQVREARALMFSAGA